MQHAGPAPLPSRAVQGRERIPPGVPGSSLEQWERRKSEILHNQENYKVLFIKLLRRHIEEEGFRLAVKIDQYTVTDKSTCQSTENDI